MRLGNHGRGLLLINCLLAPTGSELGLKPFSPHSSFQTTPVTMQVGEGQQVQIVQAQPQGQAQQAQSSSGQTMQVMQQIITNTGEIQQIPVSPARPHRPPQGR